jgi:hypothetical protein
LVTPQNDNGVSFDCDGFFADAHRILEVTGLPEPPVPCTECEVLANLVISLCFAEGGSFEDCLSEAEPILSGCALICEGTTEEKTDTCSTAAGAKNNVCLLSGEDFGVCRDEAEAFLFECSGEELPPVLCTECQELAETLTLFCIQSGDSFEDCFSQFDQILSGCALICEGTTEEKTDTCSSAVELKNHVCLLSGGDFGVCRDEAEAFFFECSGEELPPVPCTECQELVETFTLFCIQSGDTFEDCISQGEQILSECALTCEGTPEEKLEICEGAADTKNEVCEVLGEPLACQEEADDFFEACFEAPLPVCGNDLLEVGEECDGSNLNGMTCFDRGFDGGGELSCDSTCDFDTSLCEIE